MNEHAHLTTPGEQRLLKMTGLDVNKATEWLDNGSEQLTLIQTRLVALLYTRSFDFSDTKYILTDVDKNEIEQLLSKVEAIILAQDIEKDPLLGYMKPLPNHANTNS